MSNPPVKKAISFNEISPRGSSSSSHPASVRRVRTVTKISEHRTARISPQTSPPVSIPNSLHSSQENENQNEESTHEHVTTNQNDNKKITQYEEIDTESDDSMPPINKDLLQFSKLTRSSSNYGSSQVPDFFGGSPESPGNSYIDLRLPHSPDNPRKITRSNSPIVDLMEEEVDEPLHDTRYKEQSPDTAHVTDYNSTVDENRPETLHATNYEESSSLNQSQPSKTQYQSVEALPSNPPPSNAMKTSNSGIVRFSNSNFTNLYQLESSQTISGYFPSEDASSEPPISTFGSSPNYRSVTDLPSQSSAAEQYNTFGSSTSANNNNNTPNSPAVEQYNTFTTDSSINNNNALTNSNLANGYRSVTTTGQKSVVRNRQDSTIHSRTVGPDAGIHRDWNGEFQETAEMKDSYDKFVRLRDLASDFCYCAQTYGVIIISELCLPNEEKTIKPVRLGGIAGGEKYICRGIFFKFAIDENGLYGGDEHAQKAAGHDLNGLMNYRNCDVGLSFPLMVLIDYRGFRLVALSILPVNKETIIYGSHDAGNTAHAEDPAFNSLMEQTAKIMNIKGHMVGKNEKKMIFGPGDIEGHKGTDGRYYCLDFARYVPPEPPVPGLKGAILYRLLRPELVARFEMPLSPDAFCNIGLHDKNVHNEEVRKAFKFLQEEIIPMAASELDKDSESLDAEKIRSTLHGVGVNIRYLGIIRSKCTDARVKHKLLREMVARVMKCELRARQREEMRYKGFPAEQPYIKIVVDYVNSILAEDNLLDREFLETLQEKFVGALSPQEMEEGVKFDAYERLGIFKRLAVITGVRMRKKGAASASKMSFLLVSDVDRMTTIVKQLNLVDYADGMACLLEAKESAATERSRLLTVAKEKLLLAQSSFSSNIDCSLQLARVVYGICKNNRAYFTEVYEICQRIVKMNDKHYAARVLWGRALFQDTKIHSRSMPGAALEEAKKVLQEAIDTKPDEPDAYTKLIRVYRALAANTEMFSDPAPLKFQFKLGHLDEGMKVLREALSRFNSEPALCAQGMLLCFEMLSFLSDHNRTDIHDLDLLRSTTAHCCDIALPEKSKYWNTLAKMMSGPKQFWYLFQVSLLSQTLRKLFLATCNNISLENVLLSEHERDKVLLLVQSAPMESIDLSNCQGFSKDSFITVLQELAQKHIISFKHRSCEFMDQQTASTLASFTKLKTLDLNDTPTLTDELCDTIISSCVNIESLHLRGNSLSEAILVKIVKLLPLEGLFIGKIPNLDSVAELVDALAASAIKTLELQGHATLQLEDIKKICSGNSHLIELDLAGCEQVPADELININHWNGSVRKVRTPNGVPLLFSGKEKMDVSLANAGNHKRFDMVIQGTAVYSILVEASMQGHHSISLVPIHKSAFPPNKAINKPQDFTYPNDFEIEDDKSRRGICPSALNFTVAKRGVFTSINGFNTMGKKPVSMATLQWQTLTGTAVNYALNVANEKWTMFITTFGATNSHIRVSTRNDNNQLINVVELNWKFIGTSLPLILSQETNINLPLIGASLVLGLVYSK